MPQITPSEQKFNQLVAFCVAQQPCKMIVYFSACACVNYFATVMQALKTLQSTTIVPLHGKIAPHVCSEK